MSGNFLEKTFIAHDIDVKLFMMLARGTFFHTILFLAKYLMIIPRVSLRIFGMKEGNFLMRLTHNFCLNFIFSMLYIVYDTSNFG